MVSFGSLILAVACLVLATVHWNPVSSARILWEHDKTPNNDVDCSDDQKPELYFTISSLAKVTIKGKITQRQLELNWFNMIKKRGDIVAIFNRNPELSMIPPLDSVKVETLNDTFFRSSVQFPIQSFSADNLTSDCLGYWGAYYRSNMDVVALTCFRARPFWMSEIRKYIGNLNLTSLVIPGTHDAGSYKPYEGWKSEKVLIKYTYTQDDDIFTQLCFGVRTIDLRIGYYENTDEKFWINHDFIRTPNPLSKVINDIKRFLSLTQDEIVILDFHRFPYGFDNSNTHVLLIERLVMELGQLMIPKTMGYSATVNQILNSGKRLLVAYNNKARQGHDLLWEEVSQKWAEENKVEGLKEYFEKLYQQPLPGKLWAAMAELTPTTSDVIMKPHLGLRYFADLVNRNVTKWFRSEWGYKSNIISSDYYLGNNVIDMAIEINMKKGACKQTGEITSLEKSRLSYMNWPQFKLIKSQPRSMVRYLYLHQNLF